MASKPVFSVSKLRGTIYKSGRVLSDYNAFEQTFQGEEKKAVAPKTRGGLYKAGKVLGDFSALNRGQALGSAAPLVNRYARKKTGAFTGKGISAVRGQVSSPIGKRLTTRVGGRVSQKSISGFNRRGPFVPNKYRR